MAQPEQVRAAVAELTRRLREDADDDLRRRIPDRTVALVLHDLGVAHHGRLHDGALVDLVEVDAGDVPEVEVRVVMSSDELLALVDGSDSFASGWARGRIRVYAGFRTLLELRRFL